jgi:hypothetical protein
MAIPNHNPEGQPDDGYVYLGAVQPLGPRDAIVGWNYNTFNQPFDGPGDARFYGARYSELPLAPTPPDQVATPSSVVGGTSGSGGYLTLRGDGSVTAHGWAPFSGDLRASALNGPVLNKPIVGMAPTPTGNGYWLVASDGGIFSFGDATFHGSTGAMQLNQPIVGMARAPGGSGYWLVAADGGVFSFGTATFLGSMGGRGIAAVDIAPSEWGNGYWIFAADGHVYPFGAV